MSFFEFPHTRTYDSDLGWLIAKTKILLDCCDSMTSWKSEHEAEYLELKNIVEGLQNHLLDVIVPWNPGIAYQIYSMVEYMGTNYIAIQDVPIGIMITNTSYWTPANTVIAQINAIGNTVSALQAAKFYVTPEDFGAVGDGVTDDTGAFAAAFAQNLPIYCFADKTYLITAPLSTSTVHRLNGNGCTILNHTGSAGNTVSQLITFNTDAIVENVHFDSDNDGLGSLYFYYVNSFVYNCSFTGINLATILMPHQESQIRNAGGYFCIIKDCSFLNNGYNYSSDPDKLNRCITVDTIGVYALIIGCTFDTVCQGIASTFRYCVIDKCYFHSLSDNVFYDFSGLESQFNNCIVDGTDEEGIVTQAESAIINNSHFYNVKISCISMNNNMDNLTVTNCRFVRNSGNKINPIVTRSNSYVIKNITFDNNVVDEDSEVIQYIMVLGTCENLSLCGNVIKGSSASGQSSTMISITDITGLVRIVGNVIENSGSINILIVLPINTTTGSGIIKDNKVTTNVRFNFPNGNANLSGSVLYKQTGITNLFSDTRIGSMIYAGGDPGSSDIWIAGSLWINRTAGTLWITTGGGTWTQV